VSIEAAEAGGVLLLAADCRKKGETLPYERVTTQEAEGQKAALVGWVRELAPFGTRRGGWYWYSQSGPPEAREWQGPVLNRDVALNRLVRCWLAEEAVGGGRPDNVSAPTGEAACKSCGAAVVWRRTEAGKPIPLNPRILSVVTDEGKVVRGREAHHATCPQAADYRKKG
jgi:hypothetical protein